MQADADARAYEALSQHARAAALAGLARSVLDAAAEARRAEPDAERVATLAAELGLTRDDAATPAGNVLDLLGRGPEDEAGRCLARALSARAVADRPPGTGAERARVAGELLWLSAHTAFDATGLLDVALGDAAGPVWEAIAGRVRAADRDTTRGEGRGEALVAVAALVSSSSKVAQDLAAALAADVRDPALARMLRAAPPPDATTPQNTPAPAPSPPDTAEPLVGEIVAPPRGAVATTLLALTGLLLLAQGARLVGRLALAYRRPAQVTFTSEGAVRVRWRTELLGRTLRDRDVLVPGAALARATREVRYPGIGLYAGLLALVVGTLVGISAVVDGVRSGSASLLATGLGIVALGLAVDFALTSLAPGTRARCRLLLQSRDGQRLCVGWVDPARADALLAKLAKA